jgi:PKD repeat protein
MGTISRFCGAVVACVAAIALSAAPASAILLKLSDGHWISYMPARGATSLPSTRVPGSAIGHDTSFSNLDYGGGSVMPSNRNWIVYWDPTGTSTTAPAFPSDFVTGIDQWFTDVAHDSGGHANTDSVAAQYNDSTGATAAYSSSVGGVIVDTNSYPASCTGSGFAQHCITDADLAAQVDQVGAAHLIPSGTLTNEIWIFTPSTVEICNDDTLSSCSANSLDGNGVYCAYHSATGNYIWANQPYVTNNSGCDDGNHPNSATHDADGELEGGIPHEHAESITDPLPPAGWVNNENTNDGGEIGDKCSMADLGSPSFAGTPIGGVVGDSNNPAYNQVINGHHYWYQTEWSNSGHQCLQRYTPAGSPPVASFNYCAATQSAALFDASGSSATGGVAQFQWEFNENASSQTEATSPTTTFNFPTTTTRDVALTVFAADGTSTGTALSVTPGSSCATAAFSSPATALAGQPVQFDGTASAPSAGGSLTYAWDFGDGSPAVTTPMPSHTYATPGTYQVKLTVVDGSHTEGSKTASITINDQPSASFTFAPTAAIQGTSVSFSGSGSDPDGSIARYAWDFGDGQSSAAQNPTHTFTAPGNYTVKLTVTDSAGVTASISHTVAVDELPTASFTFSPTAPAAGSAVAFTGAGSDPDGSIAQYAWDFGDGQSSTAPSPSHTYAAAGTYTVKLIVTDSTGLTGSASHTVTVASVPPPPTCASAPSLKGLTLSAATAKLKKAGCKLGTVKKPKKPKHPAPKGKKYELVVASQTRPKNRVVDVTLKYVTVKKAADLPSIDLAAALLNALTRLA